MIRLLTHSGFTEPSSGLRLEGLAIRGSAKIKVKVQTMNNFNIYVISKIKWDIYLSLWDSSKIDVYICKELL